MGLNKITFDVRLFVDEHNDVARSRKALASLLEALTKINVGWLISNPQTPYLYESGVLYEHEVPGRENWQDVPTTLLNGVGDCEDLACWRAAELRAVAGINAKPFLKFTRGPDGMNLYHVVVQLPNGMYEDPSRSLGMNGHPITYKPVYIDPIA